MSDPEGIVQNIISIFQEIASMLQGQFLSTDYSDSHWTSVFERLLRFIMFAYQFKKDLDILNADVELCSSYENGQK